MMNEKDKKLIIQLASNSITEEDFLSEFSSDQLDVKRVLEDAFDSRDPDDVEFGIVLGFRFGLPEKCVSILIKLLKADWHFKHEDIAMALQKMKAAESVESLYEAALTEFDYLDYDDSYALSVKCIWGLGDIGNGEAIEKLKLLSSVKNSIIARESKKQLDRLAS